MDTDVLIVGAGPVGLTLAIDLGKQGVKCTLIEKKEAPEFLPKMERCNARTMEIFRRIGIADKIRAAGLGSSVPMDVYVINKMNEAPLLHLDYQSVDAARADVVKSEDCSLPAEPYQLISQYTLEPLLKEVAESLPSVTVRYGVEFVEFSQDKEDVKTIVRSVNGETSTLRSKYMVGCDGGGSLVRKNLGISLRGEGNILELRQALYRCDSLFDKIPMGDGPGHGRHYHVADAQSSFLIMQDSTKHWTLHAVVEDDAAMAHQFQSIIGEPIDFEMLYVGKWKQNLLLADRYRDRRVFLAGDSAHLVIPTGGLGMNTGVGDAIDLSWKLAATLQGWAGPKVLDSYEIERRYVGDNNIGASRYASLGRRKWRAQWSPQINDNTDEGRNVRQNLASVAETEQRKTNEMIGAEMGYRYKHSPIIWDEPGGPEHNFRKYNPVAWTGVRMPHHWVSEGVSVNDLAGRGFTLVRLSESLDSGEGLLRKFKEKGIPIQTLDLFSSKARGLYTSNYILLRPDLHIAWRGKELPDDLDVLVNVVTGYTVENMSRFHAA